MAAAAPLPHIGLNLERIFALPCDTLQFNVSFKDAGTVFVSNNSAGDPAFLPHIGLLQATSGLRLVCDRQITALTLNDASLKYGRIMGASKLTYSVGFNDAIIAKQYYGSSGNPAFLPHIGLVLGGVAGQNSLACSVIPYSVAFNNAGTVTGNALQCSTISFVVTLPPAQSDNQITQAAFPYTVAMQDVALKKGYPFSASVLSYTVQFNSAGTIYDNNTDRQLFLSQLAYSATLQDITLPTVQKVCQSDTIPFSVSIRNVDLSWSGQARYLDSLVQSGGYLYPRKKRRWFEDLPTPEQIEDERIALGILPKRAKKLIEETVDRATQDVSREQANILATAYLEEEQQRKLMDRLRNKAADSNLKWRDEMFTITLTMILDALQKKADLDVLNRMMAEQEAAEAEATEVLEVFMEI